MNSSKNIFKQIISWGIIGLVFLTPLFFLPTTANFYSFNKNFLLYLVVSLFLLVGAIQMVVTKKAGLLKTSFDFPVILFCLAQIAAWAFRSPNKIEPLVFSGQTGTIIALTILYFFITKHASQNVRRSVLKAMVLSAVILGTIAILQFIGVGETLAPVDWMKDKIWTPAGASLPLIIFLLICLPLVLTAFLKKFSQSVSAAVGYGAATVLISLGVIVTVFQILPGKENAPLILPYLSAWSIAIEAFKQNPLLGVGPGNFVAAFNRFRPIVFNNAQVWNVRFGVSSSYLLHLLTVSGIIGLLTFVWITLKAVKSVKKTRKTPLYYSLLVAFLLLFLLPDNFLTLFVIFVLLALWVRQVEKEVQPTVYSLPGRWAFLPAGLLVLASGFALYFGGRAYMADVYYRRSLVALVENRGLDVYNNQIRANLLNARLTRYRLAYSQTNLALADSLARQENLTDQDRTNISQLIQQAIREAKIATTLNPASADAWENLGQLYRNLINLAADAEDWAVAALREAIRTDPVNPRIRLNLGGLFFALGNYDAAIRQFQDAINLKPDYTNAYYNLAATYRQQEKWLPAYQAMEIVLNLLPVNSADYQQARQEFDELAKKIPAPEPAAQPTTPTQPVIEPPQPLPSPVIEPPIELPEESGPEVQPEEEVEPSPTPSIE